MRRVFINRDLVPISSGAPTDISSSTQVTGVDGTVRDIIVGINLNHTFTSDLIISLKAPGGQTVTLVDREGGSGDNFIGTIFDDRSSSSIDRALPPFRGRFRPQEPLSPLNGVAANGTWSLQVSDTEFFDGGSLTTWGFSFTEEEAQPVPSNFAIDVRFQGGLSNSQRNVFAAAAQFWQEAITGYGGTQDSGTLVIDASGVPIDGAGGPDGNVLGQAGPREFDAPNQLPSRGIMQFDSFDLSRMEADGSLINVIVHEMAHVIGHGTVWQRKALLVGAGTFNPQFLGTAAMREFGVLRGTNTPEPVPVANRGGPGTRDGHWRESVFGNELLTGRINGGINPVSRMSLASFEDLGYSVNFDAAQAYALPNALSLAILGVDGQGSMCCSCHCGGH